MQFICGRVSSPHLVPLFLTIHLFPDWWKKLVYIPNFCSFPRAVPLLCFYIFGKHTFTCASTLPIFANIFFTIFSYTFVLNAKNFHPACSSTRWWWNGYTVWFGRLCVILIFYVMLSADIAGMRWWVKGEFKCIFHLCADFFSMMMVLWVERKEKDLARARFWKIFHCLDWTVYYFFWILSLIWTQKDFWIILWKGNF